MIHEQFKKGDTNWKNVGLKEVYLIGILEFIMENNVSSRYLHK
ncbi:Rpn family recombination-promoting nuclease/putative transposase [Pedobacter sp. MC2016-14]|nr:Rpn family recombination-promoting nuclease/putative transposase [Pedobacter sp. MC2016-14]MCD0488183.1 Rpn family recombination-promoting nuclease/putative transposase [Pedobacter sp. MC2016-14]